MGLLKNLKKNSNQKNYDENQKTLQDEVLDAEASNPLNAHGGLANGMYNKRDMIAPSAFHRGDAKDGDWVKVGGKFVRPFVMHKFPASARVQWLDQLYNYPGDIDTAVYIQPADEREAMSELTQKIIEVETQIIEENEAGRVKRITELQSQKEKLYTQRMQLEENHERLFYVQIASNLYANSMDQLDKEAEELQSALGGSNMQLMPTWLRQDEGYKTALPYGKSYLEDKFRNFNTGAASTTFPFYNSEIIHPNGVLIGSNKSSNTPIIMDFFDKNEVVNPNINVIGKSGAGKTFFVSLLTMRSAARGIRTVIIDPENEYGPITRALGGGYLKISRNSQHFLNPFDIESEWLEDELTGEKYEVVDVHEKVAELLNLVAVMAKGISEDMETVVSEVLFQTYQEAGINKDPESLYMKDDLFDEETEEFYAEGKPKPMPTFSDFHRLLERRGKQDNDQEIINLATTLRKFTRGQLNDMFDRQTSEELRNLKDAPVITFDVSGLEENLLRPIGMYVVMQWTWEKFVKKNQHFRKRVVCDEAWMLLNTGMVGHEMTGKFLENMARRIRKRNGGLLVASQNFREFVQSKEGLAVLNNSETKFLLGQAKNDREAVQAQFRLSEGEIAYLTQADKGEFLVKTNTQSAHGYAFPFPYEQQVIAEAETYIGDVKHKRSGA